MVNRVVVDSVVVDSVVVNSVVDDVVLGVLPSSICCYLYSVIKIYQAQQFASCVSGPYVIFYLLLYFLNQCFYICPISPLASIALYTPDVHFHVFVSYTQICDENGAINTT